MARSCVASTDPYVADDADGRAQSTRHGNAAKSHSLNFFDYGAHLFLGGVIFHND